MSSPTTVTRNGPVAGRVKHDVALFAGIPYAAPPIGARRFRPPAPVEPWSEPLDATGFGPVAWQAGRLLGGLLGTASMDMSEDCLRLNVQTPAIDDARRPVMVWIHGGGFTSGTGATPWYNGTSFAARGDVVVVSLNYRLGALGFLHLADIGGADHVSSGLLGILDQVAALQWVRDNIAAFGGDPDNVTIFGESAGAMSVGTLLGLPAAHGLFHKAIAQSGATANVLPPATAAEVTATFLSAFGTTDLEALMAASPDDLVKAQQSVEAEMLANPGRLAGPEGIALGMPFQPVLDGGLGCLGQLDAVERGLSAHVPLLAGTNADEWNLFHLMSPGGLDDPGLLKRVEHLVGDGASLIETYRATRPDATPDALWCAVLTDHIFTMPALRLLEAQAAHQPDHTFQYRFSWASRAFDGRLGACHALEIPFVFNTLSQPGAHLFLGDGPEPVDLALAMHDAWIAFAHSADPSHGGLPGPWPTFDTAHRRVLEFGETIGVVEDPGPAERRLWQADARLGAAAEPR
jgi:para-nitrobenzyl esterase